MASRSDRPSTAGNPSTRYIISHGASVNINHGSTLRQSTTSGHGVVAGHGVVVTPLPAGSLIDKVLVKAVNMKAKKKDPKTFTLRNINTFILRTPELLKKEIKKQFKDDIIDEDFEIGYVHSSSVVTIRKPEDLGDIWSDIKKGQKHTLWCDGLKIHNSKRKRSDDSDDDDDSTKRRRKDDEKEEKVERIMDQLKKRHGDKFGNFQLRMWSEMYIGGHSKSLDDPPTSSMFTRAGGKSGKGNATLSGAITQMSAAICSLVPKSPPVSTTLSSPVKCIDGRYKCYKQLSEISNLKETGVLSEEEFYIEKEAIMKMLKKL